MRALLNVLLRFQMVPRAIVRYARQLLLGHGNLRLLADLFCGVGIPCTSDAGSNGADKTAVGLAAAMEEDRNAYSAQRAQDAAERKQWRGEQRDALDELLPKATAGRCGLCPGSVMCPCAVSYLPGRSRLLAGQELCLKLFLALW